MDFVPLLAAATVVITALNLVKGVKAGDTNLIVSTISAWVIGIGVVLLLAETDFASGIELGDTGHTLDNVNTFSLILVGLVFASTAQVIYDGIKALDNSQSAAKPSLIEPSTE